MEEFHTKFVHCPGVPDKTGLASSRAAEVSLPLLPNSGITSICYHTWLMKSLGPTWSLFLQ